MVNKICKLLCLVTSCSLLLGSQKQALPVQQKNKSWKSPFTLVVCTLAGGFILYKLLRRTTHYSLLHKKSQLQEKNTSTLNSTNFQAVKPSDDDASLVLKPRRKKSRWVNLLPQYIKNPSAQNPLVQPQQPLEKKVKKSFLDKFKRKSDELEKILAECDQDFPGNQCSSETQLEQKQEIENLPSEKILVACDQDFLENQYSSETQREQKQEVKNLPSIDELTENLINLQKKDENSSLTTIEELCKSLDLTTTNPYEILGIPFNASIEEIQKASSNSNYSTTSSSDNGREQKKKRLYDICIEKCLNIAKQQTHKEQKQELSDDFNSPQDSVQDTTREAY